MDLTEKGENNSYLVVLVPDCTLGKIHVTKLAFALTGRAHCQRRVAFLM